MKEAMFYEAAPDQAINCFLCSHRCQIAEGKRGFCAVRLTREGKLYSLVYGRLIAQHVDPIEKKPLFHFHPGSRAFSIATAGCNFHCRFCQNWEISQVLRESGSIFGEELPPNRIVNLAQQPGCRSIAYTYTEPVIFMEYAYDTAKLAVNESIKNVFVTNGYITEKALMELSPYLHAANIDLKSFKDEFYRKNCGARLDPVLKAIELHKKLGIWIEITT